MGDVGPLVSCDVTIAGARTQPVHAKAMLTTPGPLEQLRELVRRAAATTTSLSATDKAVRLHQLLVPKTQAAKP